jgi:hypothetical protein
VSLTGGAINGITIGNVTPAQGWFSNINTNRILGETVEVWLDGSAPNGNQYALLFDVISNASLDLGFRLKAGSALVFDCPDGDLTFVDGRLAVNTPDNGIHALQVGGLALIDTLYLGQLNPTAPNEAVSKAFVETREAYILGQIGPAVTAAVNALGNMSAQSSGTVSITGGAIDGIHIGAVNPSQGTFTQVNSNMLLGNYATVRMDGTGGYANSALSLNASSNLRPNVSVVPNSDGWFAVMGGGQSVFRSHVSGRTVVGLGADDGLHALQVHGQAYFNGRIALNGGVMSGSVTPNLGTAAPALSNGGAPIWTRIRVQTVNGIVECVVPAFPVL